MSPHDRCSIRLKEYDYSQASACFVTLATKDRELTFGEIKNDGMILNPIGELVAILWQTLPRRHLRHT